MYQKFILLILLSFILLPTYGQNIHLQVIGQTDTETKTISEAEYKSTHLNYQSVLSELDSLSSRLQKQGYINHSTTTISRINDSTINASIYLNQKFETIKIYYNPESISKNIIKQITEESYNDYFILSFPLIEEKLNRLNLILSQSGQPFTKTKLSELQIEDHFLKCNLIVYQNDTPRQIDKIIIKGYPKFPEKFLKYQAKIKTGSTLNITEITQKSKNLNELSFVNQIRAPELLFTKDSTILYIYVEKQKNNTFDGYLGFTTNENTNKLEFSGYLNLGLQNNLNFGESLRLKYRSDENSQRNFNLKLDIPYIFKSPIGTQLELNIFKKDTTFTTVDQTLKFYYQFNTKHRLYLGLNKSSSNNLLETSTSQIEDFNKTRFTSQYIYQKNSNSEQRLIPIKTYLDFEFGTGKRSISNTSENQHIIQGTAYNSFYLNPKNSIFTQVSGAALISDNYFENELFRFGGINSIRGIEENSLSATLFSVLNLEYRLKLKNDLILHSITDFAYLENKIYSQKEKIFSFGVGFMILTKAGLLKFDYANSKPENTPFNISNSKIHLSLTNYF
ncbi:POTRA domain-containing protein [Formosa sp. S-31]|uniref:POTRA domain-containing protein n=1 Tax=Formosa sp. S-31 TaxID=2790949 RepID=UPI003EBF9E3C